MDPPKACRKVVFDSVDSGCTGETQKSCVTLDMKLANYIIFTPRQVEKLDTGNSFEAHLKSECYMKHQEYVKKICFHPVIYISVLILVLAVPLFIETVAPNVTFLHYSRMSTITMSHVVFMSYL